MTPAPFPRLLPTLVFFAASCASTGGITSLDDLTAHVDPSGLLDSLPQQRVMSLAGMVPSGAPGRVYRYENTRSPFTAVGISRRRAYVHTDESGEHLEPCDHHFHLRDSADDDERRAAKRRNETESFYLRRTIEFVLPEGPEDELEEETVLSSLIEIRDQLIDVRLKASRAIRKQLERAALAAEVVTTEDQARLDTLEEQSEEALVEFGQAWKLANEMVRRPGLMVIRYNTKTSIGLGARLGNILGLNSTKSEEAAGFAVLAGIELSTLYIGTDFERWAHPPGKDWSLFGSRFPFIFGQHFPYIGQWAVDHVQVVTSRFAARHVLFASDRLTETRVQANLKASAEQLSNLGDTLAEIDEVAIDGILAAVESLGNVGILGEVQQEIVPRCRWDQVREQAPQDIYVVMTDYEDLERFAKSRTRLHFTRWW